jgi:hypothetical protein
LNRQPHQNQPGSSSRTKGRAANSPRGRRRRGRSFSDAPRWPEIERVAGRSKRSLEDVWRGFVV